MVGAKSVYESINDELKDELPVLHERSDTLLSTHLIIGFPVCHILF